METASQLCISCTIYTITTITIINIISLLFSCYHINIIANITASIPHTKNFEEPQW